PAQLSGDVWTRLVDGGQVVDGFSGATALAVAANLPEGVGAVDALNQAGFTFSRLAGGVIPGSIGETCFWACLIGAAVLI
ncbi:MAG: NADH:ubiquinone reductase (Na(+)-transporting) subunit B, partial [Gammaproteobacteria bacterium]|nr:NADH:ubiquinone reductase (Na(+)-transporting) subunit B [Gammaproteobacteria bacterium]